MDQSGFAAIRKRPGMAAADDWHEQRRMAQQRRAENRRGRQSLVANRAGRRDHHCCGDSQRGGGGQSDLTIGMSSGAWHSNGGLKIDAAGNLWSPTGQEGAITIAAATASAATAANPPKWTISSTGIEELVTMEIGRASC